MSLGRIVIAAVISAVAVSAQTPVSPATARAALVVSTAWVGQHLADPDLVLLHVGDKAEYDAGHLPGARFADLAQLAVTDRSGSGLSLEMLAPDVLRERLAALGISDRSRIVVYYGGNRVPQTTRVIFTLDYAGLGARTSLLDGGMPAWVRDGRQTTAAVPDVRPGTLSPLAIRPIVVDADYVKARLKTPGTAIVDARAPAFYSGAQTGGSPQTPHKTGHIAGALNVPFTDITDAQGQVRSAEELAALFANAGVKPGDTVIAYCHIGQQATALAFGARTLGYSVLLYDGSFEDWSRKDLPVER
jgi:thiosulfate/3-mercaptopyruvate sulfurtransferase